MCSLKKIADINAYYTPLSSTLQICQLYKLVEASVFRFSAQGREYLFLLLMQNFTFCENSKDHFSDNEEF